MSDNIPLSPFQNFSPEVAAANLPGAALEKFRPCSASNVQLSGSIVEQLPGLAGVTLFSVAAGKRISKISSPEGGIPDINLRGARVIENPKSLDQRRQEATSQNLQVQ